MRRRSVVLLTVVASVIAAAAATASNRADPAVRVGVVVDCVGFFRSYEGLMLAGAELPFLDRGAHLRSTDPSDGVTDAKLPDGRHAHLAVACDEGGEFSTLIAAVRQLVEQEHVSVVVAGTWPGDGIVLGQIARRYPQVAFIAASTGPDEVTLARPSPNLFRIRPSWAQQAAGLGTYAHERLGWHRVAVLVEDDEEGWDEAAAFTTELCSAGGRTERRLGFPLTLTRAAATQLAQRVDGVAVFAAGVTDPAALLPVLRTTFGPRRLIVGIGIASDARAARTLRGVISPAVVPAPSSGLSRRLRTAFPALPAGAADSGFVIDFDTSVEAVLKAAASPGDLRAALAKLEMAVPGGSLRVRLDGQATVPVRLVRHQGAHSHTLARLPAVPPLLDGLLSKQEPPSRNAPSCHSGEIPHYARTLILRR
jgi:hypothetical protein